MSNTLQQLNDDHRRMAYLLGLLERELGVMERAGDADTDLMRSIMEYMSRYSDTVHHPKEDLVFERLRELDASLAEYIDNLENQHQELEASGSELLATLAHIVDGAMVERDAVVELGKAYITLLRSHMRLESDGIFQAAGRLLPESAWSDVAAAFADQRDPLFGPIVDEDFRSLFEMIQGEEHGDRPG